MTIKELKITSYLYSKFSDDDRNYKTILSRNLDLNQKEDVKTLLKFLRDWGCRQFKKEDEDLSIKSFTSWFIKYASQLPNNKTSLTTLSDKKLSSYEDIFNDLMNSIASIKKSKTKNIKTNVGPVGAAKTLFALRKNIFPPWDNPIINEFHYSKNGNGYCNYLKRTKKDLLELQTYCVKHRIDFQTLPTIIGRPNSSLPKIIDEYLWVSITRKCKPGELIKLK